MVGHTHPGCPEKSEISLMECLVGSVGCTKISILISSDPRVAAARSARSNALVLAMVWWWWCVGWCVCVGGGGGGGGHKGVSVTDGCTSHDKSSISLLPCIHSNTFGFRISAEIITDSVRTHFHKPFSIRFRERKKERQDKTIQEPLRGHRLAKCRLRSLNHKLMIC
jgi:hypothetical protein